VSNTNERPIILTADEVNAVLAGDKSQHRVIIVPDEDIGAFAVMGGSKRDWPYHSNDAESHLLEDGCEHPMNCPFGKAGDRLWVQEDWRVGAWREMLGVIAIDYKASPEITNTPWVQIDNDDDGKKSESLWIALSDELDSKGIKPNEEGHYHWPAGKAPLDWNEASNMPRWASRLLLEITDISIEHVQDITLGDSIKEACTGLMDFAVDYWMAKHGEAAWFTDPWVWVIEFKAIENSEVTTNVKPR